jgi:hypothetical protein
VAIRPIGHIQFIEESPASTPVSERSPASSPTRLSPVARNVCLDAMGIQMVSPILQLAAESPEKSPVIERSPASSPINLSPVAPNVCLDAMDQQMMSPINQFVAETPTQSPIDERSPANQSPIAAHDSLDVTHQEISPFQSPTIQPAHRRNRRRTAIT